MRQIATLLAFALGVLVGRAFWPAVQVPAPKPVEVRIRWFQGKDEHKVGQDVPGVYGPMTKPIKDMVERTEKATRKAKK